MDPMVRRCGPAATSTPVSGQTQLGCHGHGWPRLGRGPDCGGASHRYQPGKRHGGTPQESRLGGTHWWQQWMASRNSYWARSHISEVRIWPRRSPPSWLSSLHWSSKQAAWMVDLINSIRPWRTYGRGWRPLPGQLPRRDRRDHTFWSFRWGPMGQSRTALGSLATLAGGTDGSMLPWSTRTGRSARSI